MIDVKDFDLIKYSCYPEGEPKPIPSMIGIDTEAYEDGRPFLCMLSTGAEISVENVPALFFAGVPAGKLSKKQRREIERKSLFVNRHYGTYNLKYDSGALLYYLSKEEKYALWKYGSVSLKRPIDGREQKILVEYIPHKYLGFFFNRFYIKIWDVAQYFKMSLDKACGIYLGKKGKLDIETKTFTVEYVRKNLSYIREYCLKDAQSCAEIGNYLISKLDEFGIKTTALYSAASLSYEYFSSRTKIITVKRLWDYYKDVVKYAIEAYKGGKFECTARGYFKHAYQYDIVSAYPYEIRNLVNIEKARVIEGSDFIEEADYAFLRVRIEVTSALVHIPCAMKNRQGVDIYPMGVFYTTITLTEYKYLLSIGVYVKIINGFWLLNDFKSYPYRDIIDQLFIIKKKYKGVDLFLYEVSKKMMNSFYGKTLQLIPEIIGCETGEKTIYRAGRAFNPVYGAIITANTRCKVTETQNILGKDSLAVHTDSVLSLTPLPESMTNGKLGNFELQIEGEGVLIACGQYQIKGKGAYKGFKPFADTDWFSMLRSNSTKRKFMQETLHVEGWYEAVAKGHYDKINLFQKDYKEIDLNADSKRNWFKAVRCKDLLEKLEHSAPQVLYHNNKPEGW